MLEEGWRMDWPKCCGNNIRMSPVVQIILRMKMILHKIIEGTFYKDSTPEDGWRMNWLKCCGNNETQ